MAEELKVPVIPDKVAEKIQAGKKDWAIEEVLGEATVEKVAAENVARAEPVRAGQLTPITHAEAARRRTQRGETLPNMPTMRRVIPEPFRRERISIRVPGEPQKVWMSVKAVQVCPGDIVPDVGLVQDVRSRVRHRRRDEIVLPRLDHLTTGARGDDMVAVGEDTILTGPEHEMVVDSQTTVQVFRLEE